MFDEAHNIDNVCIEALSVNLRDGTLASAARNLTSLQTAIQRSKQTDAKRLQDEYNRLVQVRVKHLFIYFNFLYKLSTLLVEQSYSCNPHAAAHGSARDVCTTRGVRRASMGQFLAMNCQGCYCTAADCKL